MRYLCILGLVTLLAACLPDDGAETPAPRALTAEASGHYCGMFVVDHPGPKGQIFVADAGDPIWFPSVRDTIAFLMLPGEQKNVTVVYVNDMGKARSWKSPEPDTWVDARAAWFVLDSDKRGGMGLPEAVPFGSEAEARAFIEEHGGRLTRLDQIPVSYIFEEETAEVPPSDG